MNQDFFTMWWEQMPWWIKLLQLITLWAVICIGVCLPLITVKLYWKSIEKYFAGDFQSSQYERLAAQRQAEEAEKREAAKIQSHALLEKSNSVGQPSAFEEIRKRHQDAKYLPQ
jgi:hypothetical protein